MRFPEEYDREVLKAEDAVLSLGARATWSRRVKRRALGGLRRSRIACLVAVSCGISGCEIVGVCSAQFVYGVTVRVYDSATGAPVVDGLRGQLLQSGYSEVMEVMGNYVYGAGERSGTYAVVIRASGYQDWIREGVHVDDDGCHVDNVELRADLEPDASE